MRKFWINYKYDFCEGIIITSIFTLLYMCNIKINTYQWWIFFILLFCLSQIYFKDGKRTIIRKLIDSEVSVAITDKIQIKHKLGDLVPGVFFSIADESIIKEIEEPMDKYLKLESNDAVKVTVWNMTKQEFNTLSNDLDVILYSCRIIYTPKIEKQKGDLK